MDETRRLPPHTSSALARLQQALVLGAVLLSAGVWWRLWSSGSALAAGLAAAGILLGYMVVLGVQFAAMTLVSRMAATPALGLWALIRAWWQEVGVAAKVFAWWQPFAWRSHPDAAVPAASGRRAVVLVHGFVCNRGLWQPWLRELRRRDLPYTTVNLEPVFGSIDDYVPLIEDAVRRAQALTGQPPLLVCHSMGGLAARAWLAATPGAAGRVCGVVTIGTPHHGTWLARFSHLTNGRQMRIDGDWLRALQAREAGQPRPPFVCWYSNADNIVFPAATATLPGADNRFLPGVPHVAMAYHPKVMDTSLAMLASAGSSPSERTAS